MPFHYPIKLKQRFYNTDFPLLLISTGLFYYIIYTGNQISRNEGFVLVILIIFILSYLFFYQRNNADEFSDELNKNNISIYKSFLFIFFSGSLLWLGSETLIKSAVSVANKFEISERIISITMVAIGTSLPELAASISALRRKKGNMVVGNIVGSNILNIVLIFPIIGIGSKAVFDQVIFTRDFMVMSALTAIFILLITIGKQEGNLKKFLYPLIGSGMFVVLGFYLVSLF